MPRILIVWTSGISVEKKKALPSLPRQKSKNFGDCWSEREEVCLTVNVKQLESNNFVEVSLRAKSFLDWFTFKGTLHFKIDFSSDYSLNAPEQRVCIKNTKLNLFWWSMNSANIFWQKTWRILMHLYHFYSSSFTPCQFMTTPFYRQLGTQTIQFPCGFCSVTKHFQFHASWRHDMMFWPNIVAKLLLDWKSLKEVDCR